jgi:hypothetical protein
MTMTDPDPLPTWMRLNLDPDTIEEVVTRINRVRPSAQKKLAKDVVTIAYLDAGRRLIERYLWGPTTVADSHAFLDWLTRASICAEVRRGPDPLPKQASDGSFRDRWRSKEDFLADLVAYLNWSHHWEPHRRLARGSVPGLLDVKAPLATAIDEVAYQDLVLMTGSDQASARLTQLTLYPLARRDPAVRLAFSNMYAEILQVWGDTYRQLLDGRRMRLRPDVTVTEGTIILAAVAEGLAMRALAEGSGSIMDDNARTSLLGTTALALILAFVDQGDGRSMRELVNELGHRFQPQRDPDQSNAG